VSVAVDRRHRLDLCRDGEHLPLQGAVVADCQTSTGGVSRIAR
jgi:hypothetical protein